MILEHKNGRARLRPEQYDMFDNAIQIEKHRIALFEAPTGFGKSVIVSTIAETIALANKQNKIIIATPTNQLALEYLSIFKHDQRFAFNQSLSIDIVFGKDNYFDLRNVTTEIFEYIDKEEFYAYVETISTNEGYLIESLFDNIHIEEPYKKIVSEMIKCRSLHEGIQEMQSLDIVITNYAFLLTNVFHVKDFDISQYTVIADEVHLLMETAENMLTNSFSIYRYKALTNTLEKALQKEGIPLPSELTKKFKTQGEILNTISSQYSNPNKAGDFYVIHPSQPDSVLTKLKESFLAPQAKKGKAQEEKHTTFFDSIEMLIKKEITSTNSPDITRAYKLYNSESRELRGVLNAVQEVNVYLSPSKGYPTLTSAKGDVRGWLLTYFWDKVYSFIGVSATINTSQDDKAAFSRFGINRSSFDAWCDKVESVWDFYTRYGRFPTNEDKEFFRLVSFIDNQKRGYEGGWLSEKKCHFLIEKFGIGFFSGLTPGESSAEQEEEKAEHIKYGVKTYNPVFKQTQARAFLPDCSLIQPIHAEEEGFELWAKNMAILIAQHYNNKNSMVLCGSYKEAESIGEYLSTLISKKTPLLVANRNASAGYTIEQFKKTGGILIGIRNYGTGVNLPKKELEKLFIAKLPFPIFTTKKWMDIKERDRKSGTQFYHRTYLNEMILTFRQWIGRLIRTETDNGDLYILDSRLCNKNYEKLLSFWIEKMAVIDAIRLNVDNTKNSPTTIEDNNTFEKWINNLECSEAVRQYFIEHKTYISEKGKLPIPNIVKYDRDFRNECRDIRKVFAGIAG